MKYISVLHNVIILCYLFMYSFSLPSFNQILVWEEGINWIQMIAGISVPLELKGETITVGNAVKAYYLLPTNLSEPYPSLEDSRKNKREFPSHSLYSHIENIRTRNGNEELKSCFLKLICEYSTHPMKNHSLMSQLMDILLRPSRVSDEVIGDEYVEAETKGHTNIDCSSLFPGCRSSFFDSFVKNMFTI